MPKYNVGWTISGVTSVETNTAKEANDLVRDVMRLRNNIDSDVTQIDSSVWEVADHGND